MDNFYNFYSGETQCNPQSPGPTTRNLKIKPTFSFSSSSSDIQIVHLNFKPSTHIYSGIGDGFPNLEGLYIATQTIQFIERDNFVNLEQLSKLGLQSNKIEYLPKDVFYDLVNLKELFLNNNRIKKLPEQVFGNLRRVERIYLNSNKIEFLPRNLFTNNDELYSIYIYENVLKIVDVDFTKVAKLEILDLLNANCINFDGVGKSKIVEVQQIISQNCTASAARKNRLKIRIADYDPSYQTRILSSDRLIFS